MSNILRKPGAPAKRVENMCSIIIENKEKIIVNKSILSKSDKLWESLAEKCHVKSSTLYSYVVNNKFGLKDALFKNVLDSIVNNVESETDQSALNLSFNCPDEFSFIIKKAEFENLLVKSVQYNQRGKKKCEEIDKDESYDEYDSEMSESEDELPMVISMKEKKQNLTKWEEWAISIKNRVCSCVKSEIGDHDNAHLDSKFADKLIKETRHIPMWSNIFNNKFDFSHIRPNSSASVENEIKKIKNNVLEKREKLRE